MELGVGLQTFGGEVDASGFCCPFKTTPKVRTIQRLNWRFDHNTTTI